MNAAEIIECQADLVYQLQAHRPRGWAGKDAPPLAQYLGNLAARNLQDVEVGHFVTEHTMLGVAKARAYRVQENMTAEIERRADALDVDAVVTRDRFPSRANGLVKLEEPLRITNVQGVPQIVHWISWAGVTLASTGPDDIHGDVMTAVITLWNDVLIEPDDQIIDVWKGSARRPEVGTVKNAIKGHLGMFGRWAPVTIGYLSEGFTIEPTHWASRIVVALWELLDETVPGPDAEVVAESEDEYVPRARVKAARNTGVNEPAVTTVVLRRVSRPTRHPGSGTPMSSRIWIEAYDAWRWVGPRNGERRRVRRKIPGHWSNLDEALPTRERKIVSELRR